MRKLAFSKFVGWVIISCCLISFLNWQYSAIAHPPSLSHWQPVPSHREDRSNIKVVWLQGTPYEMGYQHGKLLHDEIASLGSEFIQGLNIVGKEFGLTQLAMRRSFPSVVEECRGLADATKDIGFGMDSCMMVAFGDVYQELFTQVLPDILFPDGCSTFVASDAATIDSHLYYGRSFDQSERPIEYWIKNPTVFVKQPKDGIPYVALAVPGAVWLDSGMNAEGITIAINAAHLRSMEQISPQGGSNLQIMAQVMKQAHTYPEAKKLMATWEHMRGNIITIADGKSQQAGVFELLGKEMAVRQMSNDDVLYATNHFLAPETVGKDIQPKQSTLLRYERFQQLLNPNQPTSYYGKVNSKTMVEMLRDRTNPQTQKQSALTLFDDNASIGGNGALRQEVFDPKNLLFWVASGEVPIPENPFVCFSMGEMLGLPNAARCESSEL